MHIFGIWLFLTLVFLGNSSKVFIDQGVMLKDYGRVHLNVNDRFISVFKKMAIPEWKLSDIPKYCYDGSGVHSSILTCTTFNKADLDYVYPTKDHGYYIQARKYFIDSALRKIQLFDSLAGLELKTHHPSNTRNRRQILAGVGVGFGILNTIFTGFVSAKLSS